MFDIDFNQKGELLLHRRKFLLYPKYWEDNINHIAFDLNWQPIKFNRENIDRVPERKGVYCFVVKPEVPNVFETSYLFYVGETTRTLKIRFVEYLNDQEGKGKPRTKVYEMLNLYKDYLHFYFAEIDDEESIKEIEKKLLNAFVPFINTMIPAARINPEIRNIYEA